MPDNEQREAERRSFGVFVSEDAQEVFIPVDPLQVEASRPVLVEYMAQRGVKSQELLWQWMAALHTAALLYRMRNHNHYEQPHLKRDDPGRP